MTDRAKEVYESAYIYHNIKVEYECANYHHKNRPSPMTASTRQAKFKLLKQAEAEFEALIANLSTLETGKHE